MTMGLCLNQHDSTFFTMNFGSASRSSNKTTPFDSQDAGMTRIPRHHLPPPPPPPSHSSNHHHNHQQHFQSPSSSHFAPAVSSHYADVSPASSSTLSTHYADEIQFAGERPHPNVRHPASMHGQSPRSRSSRGRQMTAGDGGNPSSNGVGGKKRGTGAWTEAEDAKLFDLVRTFGTKNWVSVERAMEGRDKKQCRERWCNHVNPHINDAPFSEAESIFIIDSYVRHGRQWARMSRCAELQNRPDNAIKNHFNTNLRDHYAEICRQFNIPRRQPNDLLEIDEATYARVKGRITAPPASSMRGSKASRFVSSGSGRHEASGQQDPNYLGGGFSPGKVIHHIGVPSSVGARPMDAYPYSDDRRIAHPSSYDPRHAPPSFPAPRHPPIESAARPGWNPYPPQHPAYDDRSVTSPVHRFARPGQMADVTQARFSRASLSPISSAAGYTDREVVSGGGGGSSADTGYVPERFYQSRQESAPLPPLSRTLSSARPDNYDRPRYSPSSTASSITANPPRALQLPPIGLSQISHAGSMPSTPLDDVTSPYRARSHSEIDAEHKSMLWSSMGALHQGRRAGPPSHNPSSGTGGPDRTSSSSSVGLGKGSRYMPYARPGASEDDIAYPSRRKNSSGSSSSAEREAAAGVGARIKPAGLPEPMSEERGDYRRQIASSHPQEIASSYHAFKLSPPSHQHTH